MYFTIENVLYFYLFISISLIIYNIIYIYTRNKEEKKHNYLINKYNNEYEKNIRILKEKKPINKRDYKRLIKELRKIDNLLAFSDAMQQKQYTKDFEVYKNFIYDIFLDLYIFYNKKTDMEKALFVYMVGNLKIEKYNNRVLDKRIINFLEKPSVYLVENTLKTFIVLGHKESLIQSFNILNFNQIYHNEKLISDGLLEYNGDKLELSRELWSYRDGWMTSYIVAIIKFIKSMKYDFREEFYNELIKENLDIEVQLELIRYFGKVKYNKVLYYLLNIMESNENKDTNLHIITAITLSNYPSERTIEVLKKGMKSSNWYIRNNSCTSFLSLNPSKKDIDDILSGNDKYAKDILLYKLERGDK